MDYNEKLKTYSESVVKQGIVKYSMKVGVLFGFLSAMIIKLVDLFDNSFHDVFLTSHGLTKFVTQWFVSALCFGPISWYIYYRTSKYFNKRADD